MPTLPQLTPNEQAQALHDHAGALTRAALGPKSGGLLEKLPALQARAWAHDGLGRGGALLLSDVERSNADQQALLEAGVALSVVRCDEAGYELARIRAGVPRYGTDYDEA